MRRALRQRRAMPRPKSPRTHVAGLRAFLVPLFEWPFALVLALALATALAAGWTAVSMSRDLLRSELGREPVGANGALARSAPSAPAAVGALGGETPASMRPSGAARAVRGILGANLALVASSLVIALLLARAATAPVRKLYRDARRRLRAVQREVALANERLHARNEELQRANEVLARLSITDDLTRLHNHRFFRDSLPRELKRSLRSGAPLALVLFDIDDFKQLNDRYGHAVGDAILARVAEVMKSAVREIDVLARYGGEEFALLAPGTTERGAVALAEKIRLAVSETRFSVLALEGPQAVRVTLSAGVAGFGGDERALFHAADRALYRAKASGKDCVVLAGMRVRC